MRKRVLCVILSIILAVGGMFVVGCSSKEFTVTFDLNGGELVNEVELVQTVTSSSQIKTPEVVKEGYSFVGWDTIIDQVKTSTTIKALWTIKKYKITFMSNGGTLKSGEEEQRVVSGSDIVPPVYEKTGYTLSWDKDFNTITDSTVINAVWTPKKYKITFDANGGYFEDDYDGQTPIQVVYGQEIAYLPKVKHEDTNLFFNCWVVVDNSIGKINDGKKVYDSSVWKFDSSYQLKANWVNTKDAKRINYDLDGGDFEEDGGVDYFVSSDPDFVLQNPVKAGYTFIGWTGEGIQTPQIIVTVKSGTETDLFYTAHWEIKTYAIQLDAQGGKLSQTKVSIQYGQQVGTLLPAPEKDGYVFNYWAYGNYTFSTDNAPSVVWLIDQNVTLKAIYKRILVVNYNLDYKENGSSVYTGVPSTIDGKTHINSRTIVEEEKMIDVLVDVGTPETTLSDAYQFSCWVCVSNNKEYVIDNDLIAKEKIAVDGQLTIMPKFVVKSDYNGYVLRFKVEVYAEDENNKMVLVKMDIGSNPSNMLIAEGQKIKDALKNINPKTDNIEFYFEKWTYLIGYKSYDVYENTLANASIATNKVITIVVQPKVYWNGPY